MINVHKPENDAEAFALKAILKEHTIDSEVVSFHDTAYDGLYQSQYGWGVIKVREEDYEKAQKSLPSGKVQRQLISHGTRQNKMALHHRFIVRTRS